MRSVTIIGAGRAGGALALALARAGYRLDRVVYRRADSIKPIAGLLPAETRALSFEELDTIDSNILLIATADPDIQSVANELTGRIQKNTVVFHTSGSLSSAVLIALKEEGIDVGSVHPLVSLSDPVGGSGSFARAFFCVEGTGRAVEEGIAMVDALGGHSFTISPEKKTLYHTAAVIACGHLVALLDAAIEMLEQTGIEGRSSREILQPLIESTIDNLREQGPARALTGTFARADVAGLERHLAALGQLDRQLLDIYLLLGERSLKLASEAGADPRQIEEMRRRLSIAKRNSEC